MSRTERLCGLELVRSTRVKNHGWNSKLLDEYTRSQGWIDILQAYGDGCYPRTSILPGKALVFQRDRFAWFPGIGLVVVVLQGLAEGSMP
jgi:hypothetical protein